MTGPGARRAPRRKGERDALGLPKALVPHSIRHSYVSHLTEDGVDRRFIQVNVGHETGSSTAIYTHVSDDFMNTALRKALAPALGAGAGREEG
jgi:integrase/recombinase XerC